MMNKGGQLQTEWTLLESNQKPHKGTVPHRALHSYRLSGEGGEYQINLELKN